MIKQYILEFGSRILPRFIPFIIASRQKEYFISPVGYQVISACNHKVTSTCPILHASKVDSDVVIICKNTDVGYRSFRNSYFPGTPLTDCFRLLC